MVAAGRGKIVTVASMLSFSGGFEVSPYAASKGGVAQLTRALANEWAPHGVNVNAIAPGYFRTELTAPIWRDDSGSQCRDRRPAPGRALGRAGRPRGRHRVPRLGRLRLRPRHRPAGRRRLARPLSTALPSSPSARRWRCSTRTETASPSPARASPCASPAPSRTSPSRSPASASRSPGSRVSAGTPSAT